MTLTRERKILIAVTGVAFLVLAADRMTGGGYTGPDGASAAATRPAAANPPPVGSAKTGITTTPDQSVDDASELGRPSLAQRLERTRQSLSEETPDAFQPGAKWLPAVPEPATPALTPSGFDARGFLERNRLSAVFVTDLEARAVVNGRVMRVGESIDGMTLTEVGDRWVEWKGRGATLKAALDVSR